MQGRVVSGVSCLRFEDLFCVRNECYADVVSAIKLDYQIVSEDINGVMFVGQRVCWVQDKTEQYIRLDQERGMEELCKN